MKLDILFNLKKIGEITRVSISKSGFSPVIVDEDEVIDSFISIISKALKEEKYDKSRVSSRCLR